ncbi:MAG TPA: DNA mismatch repair protein MutS [Phycisphaerales bacterium]|nr:DNA mismatch repair protein MutS [Phycisphaerales bacterium]HMP36515.1 DNA mismatch repair protein MutS [Phycisphaerales bacterium]
MADPRSTPAMRQYFRFKAEHPGCLLLFRMGDFYELFDEDAVTAHRALGITLTERTKGMPMAGVPYHAIEGYLRRLVDQGFRVAVCEQVEDPALAKGVVERAVARVLTPGTLVDESLLDEGRRNVVAAAILSGEGSEAHGAIALAEVSTGAFTLHRLSPGRGEEAILDALARLAPAEVLHAEGAQHRVLLEHARRHGVALTERPGWTFRAVDAAEALRQQFGVATLAGFGLDDADPAVSAAGALLRYLRDTQAPGRDGAPLGHLRAPRLVAESGHVAIDATTLRSLEIERTVRSGASEGSLLAAMQRARTAMGRRLLREWLCFPLADRPSIEARQRCVGAMVEDEGLRDGLLAALEGVHDVARISARAALGRATPRDLAALGRSSGRIESIAALLEGRPPFAHHAAALARLGAAIMPLARRIEAECVEAPPPHLREGGVIRDGVDAALDEARLLQRDAGAWIAEYQRALAERTGIGSLKVGFNRVFGYYIEITNAHAARVPPEFHRRQTLRGAERYITPELKEYEEKVLSAESRALRRERELFDALAAAAAAVTPALSEFAEIVAALDVLAGFAELAIRRRCVRPTIVEEPAIEILQGRHPVLDAALGERFVPNDCRLHRGDGAGARASLALITGPNMAGKSTFIRQVALIALLAHVGAFVPAESAVIGLCDRIFARIGASDELHSGQSTFMVEMTETANILHHATPRSLVILDEIGRGTSTLDGLSLAWAIAESLAARGCRTLFATHYHELTGLAERLDAVTNLQVAVREWGDEIIFLHRIVPGRADRSYGIHVARLAGVPPATVDRAEALLETLAVQTAAPAIDPGPRAAPGGDGQLSLFTEYLPHPLVARLAKLALERLTPLEAFDALREAVLEARGERQPAPPTGRGEADETRSDGGAS